MRVLSLATLAISIIVSGCTFHNDEGFIYEVALKDGNTYEVVANGYFTVYDGWFQQKDHINTYSFYYHGTTSATFKGDDVTSVRMVKKNVEEESE